MDRTLALCALGLLSAVTIRPLFGQSLGNAGTHNPDRVFPPHLLDFGVGTENLLHTEKHQRITASLAITNLTNKVALYNFLSTFSGTHFLQPRTVVGRFGFAF